MSGLKRLAYEALARDTAWPMLPVVMADMQSGEIVYVSKPAADMFGYAPEELVGQLLELLVPEDIAAAHAGWRKDVNMPKDRLMGTGRQVRGRRKDGTNFSAHVGLTAVQALDTQVGMAFIVDLTGIVATIQLSAVTIHEAAQQGLDQAATGGP